MDESYRPIMDDINRILDERYEVIEITPVWEEDGVCTRRVEATSLANQMGVFTRIRDEYREPWWREASPGENPTCYVGFPKEFADAPAGIADILAPKIEKRFELLKRLHTPPKKQAKATAKATGKKKTTTKA